VETNLEGKTVLITEAARNFGRPTALAFAQEGANLALATAENEEALAAIAEEAAKLGVKVTTGRWDIADEDQVRELVQKNLQEFGHLEVLVNNPSFPLSAHSLEDISFDLWQHKLKVEVTGTTYVCKQVLPGMIQQQWGRVINYIGLAAFQGTSPPASATELGLVGLARGIARDYGKHNITANCIGPGGVETAEELGLLLFPPGNGDPLPRWGRPEEVSFLAVCLASERSGYVTGQCLLANGGKYFL
jgi:NAD(P)-dependent dehydrogenase (short-subunit alcohol dehydrogenase family)